MDYLKGIFVLLFVIIMGLCQMDNNNYGPYEIVAKKFETCKGPKQASCGKFEVKSAENLSDIIFLLDFPKDCPVTSAKVVVSSKTNNTTKKLWNYTLNKPCEHFVLGPILAESFNLTKSNNCKINKGSYEVHLDYKTKVLMFLGKNFFYGTYTFKTISFNKVSNFFCVEVILEIKKVSSNKKE